MIEVHRIICYIFLLPTDTRNREEVSALEFFISFLVAVLGGVTCHYIIKWLDGDDKGND